MVSNPFHHLYVGDKVNPTEFVELFSHVLVEQSSLVFQPGHVVLSGVKGSGKSMLYKLFDPEVRKAYAESDRKFPVPEECSNFIGAKINITTSRCNDFGNREIDPEGSEKELLFGDFFNYLVCSDIIRSVCRLGQHKQLAQNLKIDLSAQKKGVFVKLIKGDPVWEGYLKDIKSFDALISKMRDRESKYRRFLNKNVDELDSEISRTKTSVGEPAKAIVRALRKAKIVAKDTEFIIIVDQYEELAAIKDKGEGTDYRSVVNKCISRDSTVSYRIGTRGYAWQGHVNVFGSEVPLEEDRDYKLLAIDTKLRNQEFYQNKIYKNFATDVFLRRMHFFAPSGSQSSLVMKISDALGHSKQPKEEARILAGNNKALALKLDKGWPKPIISQLKEMAEEDPLSAKLGEVWYRQKTIPKGKLTKEKLKKEWMDKSKQYWRKERIEPALLKIAGRRKQRAIYSGENEILAMSGGNILVFLSLCQSIWEYATQVSGSESPKLPIPYETQTIGVFIAARSWLDRIKTSYGRSNDRDKLIQFLGRKFASILRDDEKMSYPGHTGISLSFEDLDQNPDIKELLIEAVDHGELARFEHATRSTDKKRRYKFYLNSLYCPIFRIPHQRTKEPLYIKADVLREWLTKAKIQGIQPIKPKHQPKKFSETPPLLDVMGNNDG